MRRATSGRAVESTTATPPTAAGRTRGGCSGLVGLLAAVTVSSVANPAAGQAKRAASPAGLEGNKGQATARRSPATVPTTGEPDGVYGRFDGDLDMGFELGAELAPEQPSAAGRISAHYFSMLGAYLCYRSSFGAQGVPPFNGSVGLDLRPAFVPRWAQDMQKGPSVLDLTIDSVSAGVGAFWERPPAHSARQRRGLEVSLGFGIPLFASAPGLWLAARGVLRWPESVGTASSSARPSVLITLGWHLFLLTPLVADAG